jgi:hypothetical protein
MNKSAMDATRPAHELRPQRDGFSTDKPIITADFAEIPGLGDMTARPIIYDAR